MSDLYFLVFLPEGEDKQVLTREKITAWLDKQPWATDGWFYNLPNSIFLRSSMPISDMSKFFEGEFGARRHFFIKVDAPFWGTLPTSHWKLFDKFDK